MKQTDNQLQSLLCNSINEVVRNERNLVELVLMEEETKCVCSRDLPEQCRCVSITCIKFNIRLLHEIQLL